MAELEWDAPGSRRFETGVDRGVLYVPDGPAVPWNGLTSVTENNDREIKEFYLDGVKFLVHQVPGDFSGQIQAFTYPDELDRLVGSVEVTPGAYLSDQPARPFGLTYRTKVGTDLDGIDHGYKIHILWNLIATPSSKQYSSLGGAIAPTQFQWDLAATPVYVAGYRPSAHLVIDSTPMRDTPALIQGIEDMLYGTPLSAPSLPTLAFLVNYLTD